MTFLLLYTKFYSTQFITFKLHLKFYEGFSILNLKTMRFKVYCYISLKASKTIQPWANFKTKQNGLQYIQ